MFCVCVCVCVYVCVFVMNIRRDFFMCSFKK